MVLCSCTRKYFAVNPVVLVTAHVFGITVVVIKLACYAGCNYGVPEALASPLGITNELRFHIFMTYLEISCFICSPNPEFFVAMFLYIKIVNVFVTFVSTTRILATIFVKVIHILFVSRSLYGSSHVSLYYNTKQSYRTNQL